MAVLKVAAALTALMGFSACSHVSYLVQAGVGQLSLYNHERPLQEAIDDARTSENVRERLKWIPEIKKMVEAELGIKATKNYTTYVSLDRPYVIWSLTAADAYNLKIKEWRFPVVGAFPYLGFFKEKTAQGWAKEHDEQGLDTHIRGVTAYSTLGYLRDPLLSSMLSRRKSDLVNLIFHESTHGVIYLKGQGPFNEQIASYIGDYGERAWIERNHGKDSKELRDWHNDRLDRKRFGILLRAFAEELKNYYQASVSTAIEERRLGKVERFSAFSKRLENEPWKGAGYKRAAKMIINNASLLAFLTYEDDQHVFELLDKKCGGSVKDALSYLKNFADQWDDFKQAASGDGKPATPQSVLYARLLDSTGVACLDSSLN